MDMEMSSEDEEDGQISKLEEEEEREARLLNLTKPHIEDESSNLQDFKNVQLLRDELVKAVSLPWFEDYVKSNTRLIIQFYRFLIFITRRLRPLSRWE